MATKKADQPVKFSKDDKDKLVTMVANFHEKIMEAQEKIRAMGADGTITPDEQEEIDELEDSIKAWTAKLGKIELPDVPDEETT